MNRSSRSQIWTIPNLISALRLIGVVPFTWCALELSSLWPAIVILMAGGISDWLDGYLARKLNQTSKLGQLLDPAADRLYLASTLVVLLVKDIIPWWLVAAVIVRELVLLIPLALLNARKIPPLPVHIVGKAATLCLLYALPMLLFSDHSGWWAAFARMVGWAFSWWGIALYWVAGWFYIVQAYRILSAKPVTAGAKGQ